MLQLQKLEIEGFGPFADRQIIVFPPSKGVVVVYGENMRGKTTLLNAIRYAFFGEVLGRGAIPRKLHSLSNRELTAQGKYGFSVTLSFLFDDKAYELHRSCRPIVGEPKEDSDYRHEALLRLGSSVLGPHEKEHALALIFPKDISRFFLFDGELLQEYEELIIAESEVGPQISSAIERILGVPILKAGRLHLTTLADEADKIAAREAQQHKKTEALGVSLAHALQKRTEHQSELGRKEGELRTLIDRKAQVEAKLASDRKHADLLKRREEAHEAADKAAGEQVQTRATLKAVMTHAWRSVLRNPVRRAREAAQAMLRQQIEGLTTQLRVAAIQTGHCSVCEQTVSAALKSSLSAKARNPSGFTPPQSRGSIANLEVLNFFDDADRSGDVRQLMRRLQELAVEEKVKRDEVSDLDADLKGADPTSVRSTQAAYAEVIEHITIVRGAVAGEEQKIAELTQSIDRLRDQLRNVRGGDLDSLEARARLFRESASIFHDAIEAYKRDLRLRVEACATELFLAMTTETTDYARLSINNDYGLTIIHRDGRPEDARSAGAEHVVALALMGALQRNAPLRGPIVMDSPFGRLDEGHTSNVVQALHRMADQVVLLVYESEVGRQRARQLLGSHLMAEYELERVSSRRTNIRKVR